jgi:hypothetical protein
MNNYFNQINDLNPDVYSSTIFSYLNENNSLNYLALADFTLRFPPRNNLMLPTSSTTSTSTSSSSSSKNNNNNSNDNNKPVKFSIGNDDTDAEEEKEENDDDGEGCSARKRFKSSEDRTSTALTSASNESSLKHLYLRNIRNIENLSDHQMESMKSFLSLQFNLHTLDLVGIYLDSDFLASIIVNLERLQVFNFGHGKSLKKPRKQQQLQQQQQYLRQQQQISDMKPKSASSKIDIDLINHSISTHCRNLTHLGIFYRQCELHFEADRSVKFKNKYLFELIRSCRQLKSIMYLKSFKFDDNDEDDLNAEQIEQSEKSVKRSSNYYEFIRFAIQNASTTSFRVNMQPCYGFDISPSSIISKNSNSNKFLETNLPIIKPPRNDFHSNIILV